MKIEKFRVLMLAILSLTVGSILTIARTNASQQSGENDENTVDNSQGTEKEDQKTDNGNKSCYDSSNQFAICRYGQYTVPQVPQFESPSKPKN
ncbi:MAG: hypothetical protein LBB13_00725 [Rickettsiales bacterium]|jgi:hypothetical protein|nr:hypothetical protein [Rickettsiales bacterium]